MIEDLHHIQLSMPKNREADARHFYCDVLEFREVEKPVELRGRGGAWFETRNVRLHIGVEEHFIPAKKAHPGFRIRSLKQTIERLDAANVAYKTDIDLPDIKRIYINDPFGNRIELLEVITN